MQLQQRRPAWDISESRGTPVVAQGRRLTPIGRVVRVTWPGGAFVWHRPAAVEIQQGEERKLVPIVNMTRRMSFFVSLSGVVFVVLVTLVTLGKRAFSNR